MIFDFETYSSRLGLGNIAHSLLANMISVIMPQTSRNMNLTIILMFRELVNDTSTG
jgi:hypothetical protein